MNFGTNITQGLLESVRRMGFLGFLLVQIW
uniref:Uncharacterized protein n=1 Tax=Arundo donax TaxID=35708 RepID=A0A0A8Z9Y3_ARUDO